MSMTQHRLARVLGGAVLLASLPIATSRADDSDSQKQVVYGVGAGAGVGALGGAHGIWTDASMSVDLLLSPSHYLRIEPTLFFGSGAETKNLVKPMRSANDDAEEEQARRAFGVLTRVMPGWGGDGMFTWRMGFFVGVARGSMDSPRCGQFSYVDMSAGLTAATMVRFGSDRQFEAGVSGDFGYFPTMQCHNNSSAGAQLGFDPWHPVLEEASDVSGAGTFHVGYMWR